VADWQVGSMMYGTEVVGVGQIRDLSRENASAIVAANSSLRNGVFYAVDGQNFNRMWQITPQDALLRAWGGLNVYTPQQEIAFDLATRAGFGMAPIIPPRLNQSGWNYNAHYHVFWQHYPINTELNAHIYFGELRDGGGRVIRP